MKQLEAVYLANAILYIKSIETIIKLIQVNKKCLEATKIIRYYSTRKLHENDEDEIHDYVVVKNIFDLFPNIETVNCREEIIRNFSDILGEVKQIELNPFGLEKIKITQEIKDKIIKMNIICYSLENIRINEFPNVKKVKIDYFQDGHLKNFLGDNQIYLKQMMIQAKDSEELNILKDYKNIQIKTFKLKNKVSRGRYLYLKQFANVYSEYPIDGINIIDTFFSFVSVKISNEYDIDKLYDLTLFKKCQIGNDCDLRKCELLEEIIPLYSRIDDLSIQIKGLNKIKSIKGIKTVDCIPSSVTYLSFNPHQFNYNELLEKDINCLSNIKEVEVETLWNGPIVSSKLLLNFKSCTGIEINNQGNSGTWYEFPINVKELRINHCSNNEQFKEIGKIKGLKKLTIQFDLDVKKRKVQKMYDKLNVLEQLTTDYVNQLELPLSLTCLYLDLEENNVDLMKYTNLKEIEIHCYSNTKKIKLPPYLDLLNIYGKAVVINSEDIKINRLILDNTPSQLSTWFYDSIFILRDYGND